MGTSRLTLRLPAVAAAFAAACVATAAAAHDTPQTQFERGYFLQTHDHDYAGAAVA